MGRAERMKGHNFERACANLLKAVWPKAQRGYQARDGGDAPDVQGTPFHVECKVGKRPNILAALAQALEASDGRPVLVITHRDRGETLATMRLQDWLDLAHRAERAALVRPEGEPDQSAPASSDTVADALADLG